MSTATDDMPLEIYEPPELLYRADDYDDRYYYKPKNGNIEWFISTTTWLKKVMPKSPGLINWMKHNSARDIDDRLEQTSEYGTFMHATFDWFISGNSWHSGDEEWKQNYIQSHCQLEDIRCDTDRIEKWSHRIEKDLRALLAFLHERNVTPIGSELMLSGVVDGFSYAGALDLICELEFNGTTVTALVDYKSGSLWDEHTYQLIAYKKLWDQHFPDRPIQYLFNWRPKDWRSSPSYQLKNRTKEAKQVLPKFEHYLQIAKMDIQPEPRPQLEFDGELKLDSDPTDTFEEITATERELKKLEV